MADGQRTLKMKDFKEMGRTCICYNLRKAARHVTRIYDHFLRPSGLRATQFSVLMNAKLKGPLPLTKLAELTITERTTLTRNLAVLQKKGLVSLSTGSDRRERQVALTAQGEEALIAAVALWGMAQSHIEEGLSDENLGCLLKGLSDIVSHARVS